MRIRLFHKFRVGEQINLVAHNPPPQLVVRRTRLLSLSFKVDQFVVGVFQQESG